MKLSISSTYHPTHRWMTNLGVSFLDFIALLTLVMGLTLSNLTSLRCFLDMTFDDFG